MRKNILPIILCTALCIIQLLSTAAAADRSITITSEPKDTSGQVGDTLKFEIFANGEGILNYIWYLRVEDAKTGELLEETDLGSGSSIALTLTAKMTDETKRSYVYCLISDSTGDIATSAYAGITLSSNEPLKLTYQPSSEITCRVGDEVMVSAAVSISEEKLGSLTYRWYRSDSAPIRLEGENKPYLIIPTDTAGTTCYYCIVTNEKDGDIFESEASELVRVTVEANDAVEFEDVSESAWYYSAVKKVCAAGLFNGRSPKYFSPNENVTVAEAVTLACRINKIPDELTVSKEELPWYSAYVSYAVDNGIIEAELGNTANKAITRGYFAKLLAAGLGDAIDDLVEISDGSIIDVAPDSEYAESIYRLFRSGILTGYEDGSFHPEAAITRAEAAAALSRTIR